MAQYAPAAKRQQGLLYHSRMHIPNSYLFGAILALSLLGLVIGARTAKSAMLIMCAVIAAYGLLRILF